MSEDLRLQIEATSEDVAGLRGLAPFAAGRILSAGRSSDVADVALIAGERRVGAELRVRAADVTVLPAVLEPGDAVLVPALASALAVWETLRLELGDAAVWTKAGGLAALIGQAAIWRGACPAAVLGDGAAAGEFDDRLVEFIDSSDQEAAAARLSDVVGQRPGFAAVDLSGRADMIDILLEAVPKFGRLLLAGPAGAPVTIDFYKNVHRKGIVLATTVLEPAGVLGTSLGQQTARGQVEKAVRILRSAAGSRRCRELLGATVARAAALSLAV